MTCDAIVNYYKTLIADIDGSIRGIYGTTTTGDLSFKCKAKLVLPSASVEDVLRMIN